MHQPISQRRAILEGLQPALQAFNYRVLRQGGPPQPSHPAVLHGRAERQNGFGIVERPTGAVRGVHRGHSAACKAAEQHPCTSAVVRLSHAALDCSHRLRSLRAVRCKLMISPELSTIQHNKERSALLEVEVAEFLKRGGVIKTKRPFL